VYERIFSENPLMGIRRIFRADADGENYTIETQQRVDPIFDHNAAIRSHKADKHQGVKFDPKKHMHHVASIPVTEFFRLKREGIIGYDDVNGATILDEPRFVKYLNDRDFNKNRTHEGRV